MEKTVNTPLSKYLEDSKSLEKCYSELRSQLRNDGFLESLARVLVTEPCQSLPSKAIYFHGKLADK